jgi:hypothetical protein
MTPRPGDITEAEYVELPKRFNLEKFDGRSLMELARSARQSYMVFTTKRHDGFCIFDSSNTTYKITNTPYISWPTLNLRTVAERRGGGVEVNMHVPLACYAAARSNP